MFSYLPGKTPTREVDARDSAQHDPTGRSGQAPYRLAPAGQRTAIRLIQAKEGYGAIIGALIVNENGSGAGCADDRADRRRWLLGEAVGQTDRRAGGTEEPLDRIVQRHPDEGVGRPLIDDDDCSRGREQVAGSPEDVPWSAQVVQRLEDENLVKWLRRDQLSLRPRSLLGIERPFTSL